VDFYGFRSECMAVQTAADGCPYLAKVGVEGSNPFARSNQINYLWLRHGAAALSLMQGTYGRSEGAYGRSEGAYGKSDVQG
jgi:hypothetical protein